MKKLRPTPLLLPLLAALLFASPATAATVLFDEGHGQRFLVEKKEPLDLSRFGEIVVESGATVQTVKEPISPATLSSTHALVISGPFSPHSPEEIDAIADFLAKGGKVAVLIHIGQPLVPLMARLGVDYSSRPVHEGNNIIDGNSLNFRAAGSDSHPVTAGTTIGFYGAWALDLTGPGTVLSRTTDSGWIDLDGDGRLSAGDATGSFPVVVAGKVGRGEFIVFGDDAVIQNKFLDKGNQPLATNLAEWLNN